jgi:hypothetical protein
MVMTEELKAEACSALDRMARVAIGKGIGIETEHLLSSFLRGRDSKIPMEIDAASVAGWIGSSVSQGT